MARRTRAVAATVSVPDPEFIGTTYSNQELAFLIEHLGEPSEVAMPEDEELPAGVNPAAVGPILDRTHRLQLIEDSMNEKHGSDNRLWCGFDMLKDVCVKTLDWNATVLELKRRTKGSAPELRRAAGAPSLHMWDPYTDVPYEYGVGSDSDFCRTALDENGKRVPLYVALQQTGLGAIRSLAGVAKFLKSRTPEEMQDRAQEAPSELVYDYGETTAVVKCPICGATEVFDPNKPSTKKPAIQRLMKHLETPRVKKDQHRILLNRLRRPGKLTAATAPPKPEPEPELAEVE